MIMHPSLSLQPRPGETPTSFCSCAAHKIGRTAREFAGSIGTSFQEIVDGAFEAIDILTSTCGVASDAFETTTLVRTGGRTYSLAGQDFTRETLTRGDLFVCPRCISEDIEDSDIYGAHGRAIWQIEAVRVCLKHGCMLVPVNHDLAPGRMHDFAWHVHAGLKNILDADVMTMPSGTDGLARHLERRISGTEPDSWLSTMPAYAAAKSCEFVGLTLRHGVHAPWKSKTSADWHLAGSEGYALLSAGPDALVEYFKDLRRAAPVTEYGFRAIYGRIFDYLSHDNKSEAFAPIRKVMRDHLLETTAFGADDIVLGTPVGTRRLHSVRSLAVETGRDPRMLLRRLRALGIVTKSKTRLQHDRILFDAQANAALIEKMVNALDRPEAERYLNLGRTQGYLLNPPFLTPFWTEGLHSAEHLFLKSDLDAFLAMMTRNATPLQPDEEGFLRIGKAASRSQRPAAQVVQLLMFGRLTKVRLDPDSSGVDAILIDPEEVREFLNPMANLVAVRMLMSELRCSQHTAQALMETGALPSRIERHPINRLTCRLAEISDVEAFKAEYVSVYILAEEVGMHVRLLGDRLIDLAVPTAFDPEEIGTLFYRRSDLLPFMHKLRA